METKTSSSFPAYRPPAIINQRPPAKAATVVIVPSVKAMIHRRVMVNMLSSKACRTLLIKEAERIL